MIQFTLFYQFASNEKLYDLDGNQFTEAEILQVYVDVLEEFKRKNPMFIGSKIIYAPKKMKANQNITHYFKTIRELRVQFPHFLAGFDLVGQEDTAPGLVWYAEHILNLPDDIKFFFHAGETNWFGSIDENLVIDFFY